jgi:uncharacterized integral membrane protein (TIGR00698 family)
MKIDWSSLWKKEDLWAIWLGLGIVSVALVAFFAGGTIAPVAVKPPTWESFDTVLQHFAQQWYQYLILLAVWLVIFAVSTRIMGFKTKEYIPGFIGLFILSLLMLTATAWKFAHDYNIEAPLVALLLGLVVGNLVKMPKWIDTSFRTEYYIKTGIVLLGATLPFTLIIRAGPVAFMQASIVSVITFLVIYFAATRLFRLDNRFGACLGAGGSVCGVSATIAVGGAVKAEKEHVSVGISIVAVWAIVMIFILPLASRALGLAPGVAGAWIGTSEFADAAGFAAASAIGDEAAIQTYTLMKVLGRDIWIGVWALVLSIISVVVWERRSEAKAGTASERSSAWIIWWRFPKFVLGFLIASAVMSLVVASFSPEAYGETLKPLLVTPIKTFRTWTFIFTFLSIGFTTRFRELGKFGWAPLGAFTIGVLVNVPLGYFLSVVVFGAYWAGI